MVVGDREDAQGGCREKSAKTEIKSTDIVPIEESKPSPGEVCRNDGGYNFVHEIQKVANQFKIEYIHPT